MPSTCSREKVSLKITKAVNNHGSMITYPINGSRLVLNFKINKRTKNNDVNYNFRSPSINTVQPIPIYWLRAIIAFVCTALLALAQKA